ncbi:MAG TPA: hypothetical protein PKD70_15270 [Saprospiraceae bacterium]|nr:hypothetical protein [Saprospiraceae bacterium]HMP15238.1 hypothetical protein [Saprospiraceae bacterium]
MKIITNLLFLFGGGCMLIISATACEQASKMKNNVVNETNLKALHLAIENLGIRESFDNLIVLQENSCELCYAHAKYAFQTSSQKNLILVLSKRKKAIISDYPLFAGIPEESILIKEAVDIINMLVDITSDPKGPYIISYKDKVNISAVKVIK